MPADVKKQSQSLFGRAINPFNKSNVYNDKLAAGEVKLIERDRPVYIYDEHKLKVSQATQTSQSFSSNDKSENERRLSQASKYCPKCTVLLKELSKNRAEGY